MSQYGFQSLYVLAKLGYELREQFADTFDESVEGVFGQLLEALEDNERVLSLTFDDYEWVGNDCVFQYSTECRR